MTICLIANAFVYFMYYVVFVYGLFPLFSLYFIFLRAYSCYFTQVYLLHKVLKIGQHTVTFQLLNSKL